MQISKKHAHKVYIQGEKTPIYAIFTRSFNATCACIKLHVYSEGNLIADCSNLTRGFFTYIIQGCVEMIVCIDNLHTSISSKYVQSIEELGPRFVPLVLVFPRLFTVLPVFCGLLKCAFGACDEFYIHVALHV